MKIRNKRKIKWGGGGEKKHFPTVIHRTYFSVEQLFNVKISLEIYNLLTV